MNKSAIVEELKEVLSITLFFFFCFLVFLVMKKAFLAQYEIHYSGFINVIVSSLVLGKVVVLLDKLAVTKRYDVKNRSRILFRSLIYLVGYVLFTFLEHGIKALFTGELAGEALKHNFHNLSSIQGLATLLILFITFLIFNSFWILRMHVGPKKLFNLYFKE
ncbi:hypothetical protein KFE98_07560 [bacterium SCSIO 12741]|nr:hypothetical protein KFE98_07560 [bacterium SCSIO 12741]